MFDICYNDLFHIRNIASQCVVANISQNPQVFHIISWSQEEQELEIEALAVVKQSGACGNTTVGWQNRWMSLES